VLQATVAQAAVKMDEPELIRAAQRGDQRAFEELVRLYDRNVLRMALNLLRSPEDANDRLIRLRLLHLIVRRSLLLLPVLKPQLLTSLERI
jgi:hypothetical protein